MIGLIWVMEAVLLGGLVVWRFVDLRAVHPSWARFLLIWGAAEAGGIGLASCWPPRHRVALHTRTLA
jgi:hypothetical protein